MGVGIVVAAVVLVAAVVVLAAVGVVAAALACFGIVGPDRACSFTGK